MLPGGELPAAVVFVHGIGTNSSQTWGQLFNICESDEQLNSFTLDCYGFPSRITDFLGFMPSLQDLAHGLATELRLKHKHRNSIALICHSLGGLVARQYIVNEVRAGRIPLVKRALLLATPNNGASLAIPGKQIFSRNRQVSSLSPFSQEIANLNDDWVELGIDNKISITYVAGGADAIVSQPSAKGPPGTRLDDMLIGYDHASIIRPNTVNDTNYLLIKEFIIGSRERTKFDENAKDILSRDKLGDPLFEIYRPENENYYIIRGTDALLFKATTSGHAWLSGPSGVGKTAALQRRASLSDWRVLHIFLDSYQGKSPLGLLSAICNEMAERLGVQVMGNSMDDLPAIVRNFRTLISSLNEKRSVAILVEEIPLSPGPEYSEFLSYIPKLIHAVESEPNIDVRLLFSSINNATERLPNGSAKLRSRMQFITTGLWSEDDCDLLVRRIMSALTVELSSDEQMAIVRASQGSPRFIKAVFRRWKNGSVGSASLAELLEQARAGDL